MKINLTGSQFRTLSEFCSDIAKGLMLAAVLGQITAISFSLVERLFSTVMAVVASLLLLSLAIYFSKEEK